MYFVHFKLVIGYNLCKFNTLDEAKLFVTELDAKGVQKFYLSQEIPVKVKVKVEFG